MGKVFFLSSFFLLSNFDRYSSSFSCSLSFAPERQGVLSFSQKKKGVVFLCFCIYRTVRVLLPLFFLFFFFSLCFLPLVIIFQEGLSFPWRFFCSLDPELFLFFPFLTRTRTDRDIDFPSRANATFSLFYSPPFPSRTETCDTQRGALPPSNRPGGHSRRFPFFFFPPPPPPSLHSGGSRKRLVAVMVFSLSLSRSWRRLAK